MGAQVAPVLLDGSMGGRCRECCPALGARARCACATLDRITSEVSLTRSALRCVQVQKGLDASRSSMHALQLAAKRKLTARAVERLEHDVGTLHSHTTELRERMRGIMADYTTDDEKFHLGIPLLQCAFSLTV